MRRVFLIIFYLSFIVAGFSKPVLPEIISDNMVLQQKTNVTIWGRAHVGETIVVKPSWSSISAQATVGKDGACFGISEFSYTESKILLTVAEFNKRAIHLYEKLGFIFIEKKEIPINNKVYTHWVMGKKLYESIS